MAQKIKKINPLALIALVSFTWITPATANEINGNTTAPDYFNGNSSIEIPVPPPEEPAAPTGICPTSLEPAIKSIIGKYPNNWGILVESVQDGTLIYSHNPDKFFIPASNTKLFTTIAALQKLSLEAKIGTKSLQQWINTTNLLSNNYYAETLFRRIGGSSVVKSILTQMGINPDTYRLFDGSGLSRKNLTTPRTLVSLLKAMYYSPQRDIFMASLPVAGVSGTLRNRMRATPAQGNIMAKTGTLRGVRALSGYLNHPQSGTLVFSVLVNNSSVSDTALVNSVDRIMVQVSGPISCQSGL